MNTELLIPFTLKDEIKKQYKIKWDTDKKLWTYEGNLPDALNKYTIKNIGVSYEDKDTLKEKLKSMKWDATNKVWIVSLEDYEIFIKN